MTENNTNERFRRNKEEFIKITSHKLLGPLSAIKWSTQIIKKNESLSEDGLSKLSSIDEQVDKLADFSNLLLTVSDASGIKCLDEKIEIDFCEIVNNLESEFEMEIAEKELAFLKNIPDCKVHIYTSKRIVRALLRIVLENAVKYSIKNTEIEVSVKVNKSILNIQVGNYGPGISLEEKDLIFEPFYRGKNISKIDVSGDGIDLYLAKKYVDALGGEIFYESIPNDKTIFCVNIPLGE